MKLPKTFLPEKSLENNVQRLLSKEGHVLQRSLVLFEDLEVESESYKEHYHFCTSLKRLKKAGYERHLRPWESFSIITEYFEKKLPPDLELFTKEMLNIQGEWFSMALERKGDTLFCFADPENLKQNRNGWRYFTDENLNYNDAMSKELSVKGIPSGTWVPLDQFNDEFVKYFYNLRRIDLPREFRIGPYSAQVYIPPEGGIWPASRGSGINMLYVYTCCTYALSRGMKRRKARNDKNT